jgi:hypothetical protein
LNHRQKRIFRQNNHESVSRIGFDFSSNPDEKKTPSNLNEKGLENLRPYRYNGSRVF